MTDPYMRPPNPARQVTPERAVSSASWELWSPDIAVPALRSPSQLAIEMERAS